MQEKTKEELDVNLKSIFDDRNEAISKANGTTDSELWSNFFKKEIQFYHAILLYDDIGEEANPELSKLFSQQCYEQNALRDVLYSNSKEEDFLNIVRETPHEKIYIDYLQTSINQVKSLQKNFLQQFSDGSNKLTFTDEKVDEYMEWIDCTYSRPLLVLGELLNLQNEREIDPRVLQNVTGSVQNIFESGKIDSNKVQGTILEDVVKGEFKDPNVQLEVSASPEKMQEFVEKVKYSDEQLTALYLNSCGLYTQFVMNNPDGVPSVINGQKQVYKPEDPQA